jgi:hypothetical protein
MAARRGMTKGRHVCAIAIAGMGLLGTPLYAQSVGFNDVRPTAYDPIGIGVGGFQVFPTVQGKLAYDDNIFLRENNVVSDEIITVVPSLRARSNWSSNSVNLNASSTLRRYLSHKDQNSNEYQAQIDGQLDIRRSWIADATAGYGHLIEPRGTAGNDFVTGEPVRYDHYNAAARTTKTFSRIAISGGISADRYRYQDIQSGGLSVDQSFRDHDTVAANFRVDNRIGSTSNLFVSGSVNHIRYDNQESRNSNGYSILGGIKFEVTRLLHGEAAIGYISQSFKDPRFRGFGGLNFNANLVYEPTRLTTFRLRANRSVTDSALVGVPGVLQSQIRFEAEHELLRRLILSAYVEGDREVYRGLDRRQNRYYAGAGARYYLTQHLAATISYDHQQQSTNGLASGNKYHGNRATISILIQN